MREPCAAMPIACLVRLATSLRMQLPFSLSDKRPLTGQLDVVVGKGRLWRMAPLQGRVLSHLPPAVAVPSGKIHHPNGAAPVSRDDDRSVFWGAIHQLPDQLTSPV